MKIFFGVTFPKGLIIGALLCKKKRKKITVYLKYLNK